MQAYRNGTPMLASSGYIAQVDAELCAACRSCASHCQFGAISLDEGYATVDVAACMGCGECVAHCSQEAISLLRDPAKTEDEVLNKDGCLAIRHFLIPSSLTQIRIWL